MAGHGCQPRHHANPRYPSILDPVISSAVKLRTYKTVKANTRQSKPDIRPFRPDFGLAGTRRHTEAKAVWLAMAANRATMRLPGH